MTSNRAELEHDNSYTEDGNMTTDIQRHGNSYTEDGSGRLKSGRMGVRVCLRWGAGLYNKSVLPGPIFSGMCKNGAISVADQLPLTLVIIGMVVKSPPCWVKCERNPCAAIYGFFRPCVLRISIWGGA